MKKKKILHICLLDKFIPSFIDFIKDNFEFEQHTFLLIGDINRFPVQLGENIIHIKKKSQFLMILHEMNRARKIILHSIFLTKLVKLLAFQPWLLKKCYWVIWGGDLYIHESESKDWRWHKDEFIRKFLIRRLGHLITFFKGEYDLAVNWYGANGQHHRCFTYPSNIYKKTILKAEIDETINIQVGNSATQTNQHFAVIERLSEYKEENIKIFVPLSYGDGEYAKKVIEVGKSVFGDKFIPILDFMAYDEYLNFLAKIDIAIFNHSRQQGVGNMITLLGSGKKVYLPSNVTSWESLRQYGLHVFDVKKFDISPISKSEAEQNKNIILEHFSASTLFEQLKRIFAVDSVTS